MTPTVERDEEGHLIRRCMLCGASITLCMGHVLPRDLLAAFDGKILPTEIREICGRCDTTWDPFTWVDSRASG